MNVFTDSLQIKEMLDAGLRAYVGGKQIYKKLPTLYFCAGSATYFTPPPDKLQHRRNCDFHTPATLRIYAYRSQIASDSWVSQSCRPGSWWNHSLFRSHSHTHGHPVKQPPTNLHPVLKVVELIYISEMAYTHTINLITLVMGRRNRSLNYVHTWSNTRGFHGL